MSALTMTLTEFLLARIVEDRAFARSVRKGRMNEPRETPYDYDYDRLLRRVLAECEAKQALVERVGNPAWVGFRVLAAVYADHPDYRQEWRP